MKHDVIVPYGRRRLRFRLPAHRLMGVLSGPLEGSKGIRKMVSDSLEVSLNKKKAEAMLKGKKNILIVVPDKTRSAHLKDILPGLLSRLRSSSGRVTIVVATGLHKEHATEEIETLVGKAVAKRYRLVSHNQRAGTFIDLGKTRGGVPIVLNRLLLSADLIITIGCVEPHLYAGYSGGAKTIATGLAGERSINVTHGAGFLDHPRTRIGLVERNPFQGALWEIIKGLPVEFSVNVVNDPEGKALAVFSGRLKDVFRRSVDFARGVFEVGVKAPADVVICGVGHPKDINLYQASRAVNYVANIDRPVLKKGGVLIVVAELNDGIGDGLSERRFYKELSDMKSPEDLIRKAKSRGCVAGAHRAYMVARPLLDYNIVFVSYGRKTFMRGLPFGYFGTIKKSIQFADRVTGMNSKIYVIPHTLSTIARLCK